MKRILIIVCLLFTANSWADDEEFPIELTCELGNLILYYNITDNPETTWWQNHSSNRSTPTMLSLLDYTINKDKNLTHPQINRNYLVANKRNYKKEKNHEITDEHFYFYTRDTTTNRIGREKFFSYINRKTGKVTLFTMVSIEITYTYNGHCTKGFKNYEKNVF